jgi:multidrug transporter EmrE-like cation transporter
VLQIVLRAARIFHDGMHLFFLSRTMTVLQWIGLGLIVASVISMQMATLVQSRKR